MDIGRRDTTMHVITERQNNNKRRTYHIEGPAAKTVSRFWQYLVLIGEIKSFEVTTDE